MIATMSAIPYPIAATPEEALSPGRPRASREREAQTLAAEPVSFETDRFGPPFASREAALSAYPGAVEDAGSPVAPEDRFCQLVQVMAQGVAPPPAQPTLKDGRRWPAPPSPPATVWRLQVSYWRPLSAAPALPETQARHPRRKASERLDATAVRALPRQPLQPVKPQQPLDIGLFERRLPENPSIIVPDE